MDSSSHRNSAELQHFLEQEKQKAMLNEMVAKLTNVCWDKCITSTPGNKFSSGESSCLSNCPTLYGYVYDHYETLSVHALKVLTTTLSSLPFLI